MFKKILLKHTNDQTDSKKLLLLCGVHWLTLIVIGFLETRILLVCSKKHYSYKKCFGVILSKTCVYLFLLVRRLFLFKRMKSTEILTYWSSCLKFFSCLLVSVLCDIDSVSIINLCLRYYRVNEKEYFTQK